VSLLLKHAENLYAVAEAAAGPGAGAQELAILVRADGGLHVVQAEGWSLAQIAEHHGVRTAYRVSRKGTAVRVEGTMGTQSCLLEGRPPGLLAQEWLRDRPAYELQERTGQPGSLGIDTGVHCSSGTRLLPAISAAAETVLPTH
jgi:hypothetical protein